MRIAGTSTLVLVLLALAGCGSNTPPPEASTDPALVQTQRLGRLAYDQDRPDQAASLYRQALDRAYRRDDLRAIGDAGYNLAVVELARGDTAAALALARSTADELGRRGQPIPADLQLIEAVALYRRGDAATAGALAAAVAARPDASADTTARAIFLTGLVADERGETTALAAAAAALDATSDAGIKADRDELAGRLALRRGDPAAAHAAFAAAAEGRRLRREDRGMARALALAGRAAAQQGDQAAAADLYLRAGRSAALSADPTGAAEWLTTAGALARQAGALAIADEAEVRLAALRATAAP